MDVFFRTFLPAAAGAGVTAPAVSRHLSVLRRCVAASDATLIATRCTRAGAPARGDYLFLLTGRRLVVTHRSRLRRRLRLHLNAELRHLSNVTWSPDPHRGTIEVAITAIDGVRERFILRVGQQSPPGQLEALLAYAFDGPASGGTVPPTTPVTTAPTTASVGTAPATTTSAAAAPAVVPAGVTRPPRIPLAALLRT